MSGSAPELSPDELRPLPLRPDPRSLLAQATTLVADDLQQVEERLASMLDSEVGAIPRVAGHVAFAGGKRFRPLLALLSAQAAGYDDEARLAVAAVGELLHTATLLHDDVIDGGEYRRGRRAARLEFGNGMAVLTGDFCLARGLQTIAALGRTGAVRSMAAAVMRMAEGEVAQLDVAGQWALDRERYYRVVERKTAALIGWCSSVAGLLEAPHRTALEHYGIEVGYAFQIADDVIDYAHGVERSGKDRGQDLRDGKLTLPAIFACEDDPSLRRHLRVLFEGGPATDPGAVEEIVARVAASPALHRCRRAASAHADAAVAQLAQLPPSRARDALAAVADAVARRDV
jgi:octaprenyl-diphosphate synthase